MGSKLKYYLYDGEGDVRVIDDVSVVKLISSQVSRLAYVCTTPGGKFYVVCPQPVAVSGLALPSSSEMELEVYGVIEKDFEETLGAWCWLRLHSTRALVIRSDEEVIH